MVIEISDEALDAFLGWGDSTEFAYLAPELKEFIEAFFQLARPMQIALSGFLVRAVRLLGPFPKG